MKDTEIELLLLTAKKLKGSTLAENEVELLKEYYNSGNGSIFNKMRMAMQMVLNIDTSTFDRRKFSYDPTRETLKELRELAEKLEEDIGCSDRSEE